MKRVHENDDGFIVNGEINFNNVMRLREQGILLLKQCKQTSVNIDLSGVTKIDNVALALLTAWFRDARQVNKTVIYKNLPKALENMVHVFGVNFLFSENPSQLPLEKMGAPAEAS